MGLFDSLPRQPVSRRRFLKAGMWGAAGLALYAGEIERHWLQVTRRDIGLRGLPAAFDGLRIAQISDIHLDEYTEPFFLRHVIDRVNRMEPDAVALTGDYVTDGFGSGNYAIGAAWQCANILSGLRCRQRYAVLGNHDVVVGEEEVSAALTANGVTVLKNACLPMERSGGRIWLAGLDDPVNGNPHPELAIPASIRNVPNEPIVLMCHAPDYADDLLAHPAGKAVGLMLSGHTHGGQIRLPLLGALGLPDLGRKYVEGWFRLGGLQLYVNRGIGTVGLPFRINCPPEITLITLRTG
ncbi:MAG: metallophosphoesterase [Terracidiphilus sp.]|jgi:predicted MPP superfamily phosphohydrolase